MTTQKPRFYLFGQETWDAMLEAISNARETIDLEQFIFFDDDIGLKFVEVLRDRARAGVKVRLLCDTVGSWSFYTSHLPSLMKKDGVEIRFINKVGPWRIGSFFSWFFRDHRKILIVDSRVGFTGGIGMRDDMPDWRDTNVEVEGDVVKEMLYAFNEMWTQAIDKDIISRIKKARQFVRGFHFVTNSPHLGKRYLYKSIIDSLRSAHKHIYIATPYFVPNPKLLRTLRLAVERGVDVKIILPDRGVELFVYSATHSHYQRVLETGIKIFEYNKSFLHTKTIIVDDEWSTVGSFNLDSLSFFYNYEANIVSTDKYFVDCLKDHFLNDIKNSTEIKLEKWLTRPLVQKVREFFVIPIRRFL